MKALNRLKAKLLLIATEQGVSSAKNIKREAIADMWQQEVRRYVFHPYYKLVQDVKTSVQLPDLTSVLDGNIEPFIKAHISIRQAKDTRESCKSWFYIRIQTETVLLLQFETILFRNRKNLR